MGSVKDLKLDGLEGKLYKAPEPHKFGQGAWKVSGRFSVADMKGLIPDVEIPNKNYILAMTAARYWEAAAADGIESCYIGMMDHDGNIVDTETIIKKGDLSDIIVMKLANTPAPKDGKKLTDDDIRAYHQAIANKDISVYVADAESIFRAGFPLGSSVFKGIFKRAGMGDTYEKLAMYDETVTALDIIRGKINEKGIGRFPGLEKYLADFHLTGIPNPGDTLAEPVYDFTTKFEISGDQAITPEEARHRMGISPEEYGVWKNTVKNCAKHQIGYCKQRVITNIDGKLEAVVSDGKTILADFACTVDENRLMIKHQDEKEGIVYLIPSNKEIQRAIFRKNGVYTAVDQAKEKYGSQWRERFFEFYDKKKLEDATRESCEMLAAAISTVGNRIMQRSVFENVTAVSAWVGPFLPYASRSKEKPTSRYLRAKKQ